MYYYSRRSFFFNEILNRQPVSSEFNVSQLIYLHGRRHLLFKTLHIRFSFNILVNNRRYGNNRYRRLLLPPRGGAGLNYVEQIVPIA